MPRSSKDPEAVELLGLRVDALSRDELTERVAQMIGLGSAAVVAHHNLHSAALCRDEPRLQAFYREADLAHVDGMALIGVARLLGLPLRREHRITYLDWMEPLLARAEAEGWRIFFVGGAPGVAERGWRVLRDRFPGLRVEIRHGYFDARPGSPDNEALLADITAYSPDLLMVGMGMPRQELWILENRSRLRADVVLPLGACLDYFAGVVPTPPRWLGRVGLEWAFRLGSEPRRLWKRYLVEPWILLPALLRDLRLHRLRLPRR